MYDITITLHADVTVGTGEGTGNLKASHRYIPGSTLRGALAARWIVEHGIPASLPLQQQEDFARLFEGWVRFGPCLPQQARLEPLGARFCKYRPNPECGKVVQHEADKDVIHRVCPECGGTMAVGKGAIKGQALGERTRTAMDGEVASLGNLFSTQHLPAGTVLTGGIAGQHPWLETTERTIWLGARRSTGGKATMQITRSTPPPPVPRADGAILIRLQSPGIFIGACTEPTMAFPLQEVGDVLGCPVTLSQAWTRPVLVNGWHAASGLPKPTERALAAGSEAKVVPADPAAAADPTALAVLARSGLGERQAEGFGWIEVNPQPFVPAETREPSPVVDRAKELLTAIPLPERAWLYGPMKQAVLGIEVGKGRTEVMEEFVNLPRFKRLAPVTQAHVRDVIAEQPLLLLVDLIDEMEGRR